MKFWKSFLIGTLFFGMTRSTALAVGTDSDPPSHAKITHVPRMNFGTHLADQTDSDTEQAYKISDHDQGKITPDDTSIVIESDSEQGFEVDVVFSKPKAPDGTEIDGAKIILHGVRTHTTDGKGTSASDQLDSDNVKTDLIFVPGEQQELVNADYGEGQGVTIIDFDSVEIVLDPPDNDQTYTTKMKIKVTDRPLSEDSTTTKTDDASEGQTSPDNSSDGKTPTGTDDASEDMIPPAITDGTITQEVKNTPIAKEKIFDTSLATAFDNSEIPLTVTIDDDDYNNINWDQVGTYPVQFTATDGNDNSNTGTITVKIVDTIAPEVTNGTITQEFKTTPITKDKLLSKSGATASDNSEIPPTIVIDETDYNNINWDQVGTYPVKFTATDESQNSSTGTITVKIVDTVAPSVTSVTINWKAGTPIAKNELFSQSGATATDNSGVSPTITIDPDDYKDINWKNVGASYLIGFTATDPSGNSSDGTITVKLTSVESKILIELASEYQIYFGYNTGDNGIQAKEGSISWEEGTVESGQFKDDQSLPPSTTSTGTALASGNNAVLMTFEDLTSLESAFSGLVFYDIKISTVESTPLLTDLSNMFKSSSVNSLDLSEFDTTGVTNMSGMFNDAYALGSLNLGDNFDTRQVTDMSYMFMGIMCISSETFGDKFNTSQVQNMSYMFASNMFSSELTLGDNFDTSNVTDMSYMFANSGADFGFSLTFGSNFDTSNVKYMEHMFDNFSRAANIDLGDDFDTSNVTDMSYMFHECTSLTNLTIGNKFDTSQVKYMNYMFYENNLSNSFFNTLFKDSNFNTSKVQNMSYMFGSNGQLTNLAFGRNFDTSNVKDMSYMFTDCMSLLNLDLSSFSDTSLTSVAGIEYIFDGTVNGTREIKLTTENWTKQPIIDYLNTTYKTVSDGGSLNWVSKSENNSFINSILS